MSALWKALMKISTAVSFSLLAAIIGVTPIRADFVKSDHELYVEWLDLEIEANPFPPITEYGAYAIVETGGENLPVIYVIFSSFKGKRAVHGSFRCDKVFEVLTSHQNGFYDIRCVKQNVFGVTTTSVLKYGEFGLYEEHF